jgi:hypothetical protein
MDNMTTKTKKTKKLPEHEIDQLVAAQTEADLAWEKPVSVRRHKPTSIILPASLAARAAFLAHLHRKDNVEEWLTNIIQERVELEEAAFAGARQEMASKAS